MNDKIKVIKDKLYEYIGKDNLELNNIENFGSYKVYSGSGGIIEGLNGYYFYRVDDRFNPTFRGPLTEEELIGYIGNVVCKKDVKEYNLNSEQSIMIINKVSYDLMKVIDKKKISEYDSMMRDLIQKSEKNEYNLLNPISLEEALAMTKKK